MPQVGFSEEHKAKDEHFLTTAPFKPDNAQSGVGSVKFCSTVTSMENKLQSANTDDVYHN